MKASPFGVTPAVDLRWQLALVAGAGVAFALVYFVSFGGTAWHPTDYEQTYAYAWRIAHHEVPYRDFVYHKTPGTVLLHAVWMLLPDRLEVRASRLFFYLQIAFSAALPVAWALWRKRLRFGWRLPFLVALGALLAAHNFPVMPWQTTDGVMFATLGAVAMAESLVADTRGRGWVARGVASLAFALAFLCKQSFAPLCLALGAVAFGELVRAAWMRWRRGTPFRPAAVLFLISALPAAAVGGGFAAFLALTGAWQDFMAQLASQSTAAALFEFGATGWPEDFLWVIPCAALLPFLRLWDLGRPAFSGWLTRGLAIIFLGWLCGMVRAHPAEGYGVMGSVCFYVLFGTFLGRLGALVVGWDLAQRGATLPRPDGVLLLLHAFALLIAFACRLSLGYQTPILGVAGLAWVLHDAMPQERADWEALPFAAAVWLIAPALWQVNADQPYRDGNRASLTYDLGTLFPKLSGIRTAAGNFNRYADLKEVVERYAKGPGKPYAVTQDYPGIHWLFGDRNPIALDWCYYLDIAGFEPRLLAELQRSGAVGIVPKESDAPWASDPHPGSCKQVGFEHHNGVSRFLVHTWRLTGESAYFCVYQGS